MAHAEPPRAMESAADFKSSTAGRSTPVLGQRRGPGLAAGSVDQIFSAFFITKPQGSGMGLAISRSIVESHGGRLWAAANDGRGATFHFTSPTQVTESSLWLPKRFPFLQSSRPSTLPSTHCPLLTCRAAVALFANRIMTRGRLVPSLFTTLLFCRLRIQRWPLHADTWH
jgi:hypothetical protein